MSDAEFQQFLEDISEAFVQRDYTRWRQRMRLPFSLVTASHPVTLTSEHDVHQNYLGYLEAMDILRMTDVLREPIALEPCADGTVLATYRTHLISGANRVRDPYTSTALLHPDPGMWRMSAILNALGHHHWTETPPSQTGETDD